MAQAFALDLLPSKNIIVVSIFRGFSNPRPGVVFDLTVSVGRRILLKVVHPLWRLRSGLTGTLVLFLSSILLTACIVTADQSIESNPKDPRAQDISDRIRSLDLLPRQTTDAGTRGIKQGGGDKQAAI